MLRDPVQRWTAEERASRIAAAPPFVYPPPGELELAALVDSYVRITGDPVRTGRKRNYVATGYRVHGLDYLPLVEERFRATGTATNLLGEIRFMAPRQRDAIQPETGRSRPTLDCGCRIEALLPGLVYCAAHRPPFDGNDHRRHDRHRSNPEAARFFEPPRVGVEVDDAST